MDFNLTLIGQTVAMIVFVWFCMKFIWPPVMKAIEQRRKEIADGIAAGEKGRRNWPTRGTARRRFSRMRARRPCRSWTSPTSAATTSSPKRRPPL